MSNQESVGLLSQLQRNRDASDAEEENRMREDEEDSPKRRKQHGASSEEDFTVPSHAERLAAQAWHDAGAQRGPPAHHEAQQDTGANGGDESHLDATMHHERLFSGSIAHYKTQVLHSLQRVATGEEAEERIEKHKGSTYYNTWFVRWMSFLKRFFLLIHFSYIVLVALICATVLYVSETDTGLSFLDALFIAVSSVTCTGMTTVDMTKFNWGSIFTWHLTMTLGGTVFTSAVAPITRLYTLKRLLKDEEKVRKTHKFSGSRARWGMKKCQYLRQLIITSTIVSVSTYVYWTLVQFVAFSALLVENSAGKAVTRTISLFANCAFSSAVQQAREPYTLLVFCVLIPLGSAFFPPCLRVLLYIEKRIIHLWLVAQYGRRKVHLNSTFEPLPNLNFGATDGETRPLLAETNPIPSNVQDTQSEALSVHPVRSKGVASFASLQAAAAAGRKKKVQKYRSKWISGFNRILNAKKPGVHHPFLFLKSESLYLILAWFFIVVVQLVPFFIQQWDSLLRPYTTWEKIVVATTQTIGHRFAGLQLITLDKLRPGHLLLIMFALYVPMLPIPTDRARRKWKEMLGQGVWRLFTSRFWWLFTATCIIVFVEENSLQFADETQYRIITRILFETLSAYATAGLSLPLPGQVNTSLTGDFTWSSKVIIMLVMLAGRHRGMDLGLDIGLSDLAQTQRDAAEHDPDNHQGLHDDLMGEQDDERDLHGFDVEGDMQQPGEDETARAARRSGMMLSATNVNMHNEIIVSGRYGETHGLDDEEEEEEDDDRHQTHHVHYAQDPNLARHDPQQIDSRVLTETDGQTVASSLIDEMHHVYPRSSGHQETRTSNRSQVRRRPHAGSRASSHKPVMTQNSTFGGASSVGVPSMRNGNGGSVSGVPPRLGGSFQVPSGYLAVKKNNTLENVSCGGTPDSDDLDFIHRPPPMRLPQNDTFANAAGFSVTSAAAPAGGGHSSPSGSQKKTSPTNPLGNALPGRSPPVGGLGRSPPMRQETLLPGELVNNGSLVLGRSADTPGSSLRRSGTRRSSRTEEVET